jgi:hypothetical protein
MLATPNVAYLFSDQDDQRRYFKVAGPHKEEHTQFVPGGHPSKCWLHPPWLDFSDPMIIRDFILVRPPQQPQI